MSTLSFLIGALLLLVACNACRAFIMPSQHHGDVMQQRLSYKRRTALTALQAGLFGQDGALSGIFGGGSPGPKTVFDLPANDVKIGPLRFFLQIHLVGEQNKPEPKSWLTKQGEQDGELQVYYKDGTGMLSIELQEYGIKMVRYGERPSLQYQLQESVLLHSVLDELLDIATVEDIEPTKRLLVLKQDDDIQLAREKIPARKAS
jgi:hypothetical protein